MTKLVIGPEYQRNGHFTRPDSTFRNFVSRDPNAPYPAEKDRYALYLSPGCPWAHRTLIVRMMKGLESIIDVYEMQFSLGPDGWYFSSEGGGLAADPLHGFKTLRELYLKVDPQYAGRVTVPVLWDKKTDTLVNNESSEIIRMFYSEFDDLLPPHLREENRPGGGFRPAHLVDEIDAMNDWVYNTINNGVYKCGFAITQEAYDANIPPLFESLDRLERHLTDRSTKYLFGDHITEADVRLYTTMARFDVAYHTVFMCNLKSIRHDYPQLYLWLRRLYWDRDEEGEARGAFYKTTEPSIARYAYGYAHSRHKIVGKEQGPMIVPKGPAVLIDPLPAEA